MATYIRLTECKDSDSKKEGFFKEENRYVAKQGDFSKIPGSPIAYWVSENIAKKFLNPKSNTFIETRLGMATADNERFLRLWQEISFSKAGLKFSNCEEAKKSKLKWFPYQKGGEFKKWYGNYEYLVNWENDGFEIRNFINPKTEKIKSHNYNLEYIFRNGITWNALSSGNTCMRISDNSLFDNSGSSMFVKDIENDRTLYFLSFYNTKIIPLLIKSISQTLNYQPGDIAKLPIIFPKSQKTKQTIDKLTQQCIDISKQEWDSHETSWDFKVNELVRLRREFGKGDCKIEDVYGRYCEYWEEKFFALHANEEELNRLFIDIYELQDELDFKVQLKDITILKSETKIENTELEFQKDEVVKQFISYGVGVMLGRYSLDADGLVVANLDQEYPKNTSFEIDDDNIIPILEDDYFQDDMASRFEQFVKIIFGDEYLRENIAFIEKALGVSLRKYFLKGFYEDHTKRYKKRPIYWMVSSPNKAFNALFYMHRYKSDIFARVQNLYLREYITKLESAKKIASQTNLSKEATNKEQQKASKHIETIDKKLKELISFDRDKLNRYAQDKIDIDLDDGVKVNYCKFSEILYTFDKKLCK